MKVVRYNFVYCLIALLSVTCISLWKTPESNSKNAGQSNDKLVYADFETVKDNQVISSRGGAVQIFTSQESPAQQGKFKGPEIIRTSQTDTNKAVTFDYELKGPNQYASITLEIKGQEDKDGKPVADDVSGYKNLMLQVYAKGIPTPTGVQKLRVEAISRGFGMSIPYGYPQMEFKINQGFYTYKLPLKEFAQPQWVETKLNTKEVLKKLTSLQISVFCNQCTPINGTIVIDNVVFTN